VIANYANFVAVVTGRNEGERLQRYLRSLSQAAVSCMSIQVRSMDRLNGSAIMARKFSISTEVLDLDRHVPFTAARARNAGFQRLRGLCAVRGWRLVN
jgi:hypothetical protein